VRESCGRNSGVANLDDSQLSEIVLQPRNSATDNNLTVKTLRFSIRTKFWRGTASKPDDRSCRDELQLGFGDRQCAQVAGCEAMSRRSQLSSVWRMRAKGRYGNQVREDQQREDRKSLVNS
jgi:hypothetical protein